MSRAEVSRVGVKNGSPGANPAYRGSFVSSLRIFFVGG